MPSIFKLHEPRLLNWFGDANDMMRLLKLSLVEEFLLEEKKADQPHFFKAFNEKLKLVKETCKDAIDITGMNNSIR